MIFNFNQGDSTDFTKATATANDVVSGKTFYAGDNQLKTGTLISEGAPLNTRTLTTTNISFDWYGGAEKAKLYGTNGKTYWIQRAYNTDDALRNIIYFYFSGYINLTSNYFSITIYSGFNQNTRVTSNTYFNKIEFYS